MAPNLTKPKVPADGLTKSGKKATAFLLSILKSCGMSTMSRSARPSSRFSTSRFQSMQLWGGGRGSQGGLAGVVGGGPRGHVWLRMDKMPKCPQVSPPHEPTPCEPSSKHACSGPPATASPPGRGHESVAQGAPSSTRWSPRHSLSPWQGARERGSGWPVLHPLPSRASLLRDLLQSYVQNTRHRQLPYFHPPATIPRTEVPGGLQSIGKQRGGHD